MSALRRDCGRWCVGLRCASRELPDPSTKLLVAKGLWWVQETLRCTSSGSMILKKETVGSRFTWKGNQGLKWFPYHD